MNVKDKEDTEVAWFYCLGLVFLWLVSILLEAREQDMAFPSIALSAAWCSWCWTGVTKTKICLSVSMVLGSWFAAKQLLAQLNQQQGWEMMLGTRTTDKKSHGPSFLLAFC